MILRNYQKEAIKNAKSSLKKNNNTLIVAPTGAGKTIILSALIQELTDEFHNNRNGLIKSKTVVLQHRLELVKQNSEKFVRVAPNSPLKTSILTGKEKNHDGDVVFATVQTLSASNGNGLKVIPWLDYLIIDEAHHSAADSYMDTVKHYYSINPNLKVVGLTATAARADGIGLGDTFDNVSFKIDTDTLIQMGHLVPPRSYVVDIGVNDEIDKLSKKRDTLSDESYNMKLAGIYAPIHYRIVEEWEKMASKKQTICFCTNIQEAVNLCEKFQEKGHNALYIHSKMHSKYVRSIIDNFHAGKFQLLFNVAILTEGFDCPTINCVMLTRSCSSKSTMIQMIGRGLRPIVEKKDMWMEKIDCMVMDFGDSLKTHGTLKSDINIKKVRPYKGNPVQLICPQCKKLIVVDEIDTYCPKCGAHIVEEIKNAEEKESTGSRSIGKIPLKNFSMVAINLTKNSPFAWLDISNFYHKINIKIMVASGIRNFVAMQEIDKDVWLAIGLPQKGVGVCLGVCGESVAFANCNNYLSERETSSSSKKSASWHRHTPTDPQYKLLMVLGWDPKKGDKYPKNKYEASCMISFAKSAKNYNTILNATLDERRELNESEKVKQ